MNPPVVPPHGIPIEVFEELSAVALHGTRVFRTTGAGFYKIHHPVGNIPHSFSDSISCTCGCRDDSAKVPPWIGAPPPDGGVTTVIPPESVLDASEREIQAAVWDNVEITEGEFAGQIGKVYEFRCGTPPMYDDDVFVVKTLVEGKVDANLLSRPNLGWKTRSDAAPRAKCTAGHRLTRETCPMSGYGCDLCSIPIAVNAAMFSCRACGFDACDQCIGGEAEWPLNWLEAKAIDKEWQKTTGAAEYEWPKLLDRSKTLELNATQFVRFRDYLTTEDASKLVMMPACTLSDGSSCSYVELLAMPLGAAAAPARATGLGLMSLRASPMPLTPSTHFVSHACKYDFASVVAALREFVDARGGNEVGDAVVTPPAPPCSFWFNCTTLNQHHAAAGVFQSEFWFRCFRTSIAEIASTLVVTMPWQQPVNLTRAWCVYEIFETAKPKPGGTAQTECHFLLPPRDRADMMRALIHDNSGIMLNSLTELLSTVAVEDAEGGASDRAEIMKLAKEHGIGELNQLVCGALRRWFLGTAREELERRGEDAHDEATLDLAQGLAKALWRSGDCNEAARWYHRALRGIEAARGREHVDYGTVLGNLAVALKDAGKIEEAVPLYRASIASCSAALGATHENTLAAVNNLAVQLKAHGDYPQALKLFQQAVDGWTANPSIGPAHPTTLVGMSNLAAALQDAGELDESVRVQRTAMEGLAAHPSFGWKHQKTLLCANSLACALRGMGRLDEAILYMEQVLAGYKVAFGVHHPHTIIFYETLAKMLEMTGELVYAAQLRRERYEALAATLPGGVGHQGEGMVALAECGRVTRRIASRMEEGDAMVQFAIDTLTAPPFSLEERAPALLVELATFFERAPQSEADAAAGAAKTAARRAELAR